jgi:hypothetical protein
MAVLAIEIVRSRTSISGEKKPALSEWMTQVVVVL